MTRLGRSRENSVSRLVPYGRMAVFIFAAVCVCSAVHAQYAALEWTTANADIIYVARVQANGAAGVVLRPVRGVAVIRGTAPQELRLQGWWSAHANVVGSKWLVFLRFFTNDVYGGDPPPVPEIDTGSPYLVPLDGSAKEFTLWMRPVTAPDSLLSIVRDAARNIPQHPAHLDLMDPPIQQIGGGMDTPSIRLPVCPELERSARALIERPRNRADVDAGLIMLAPFKSAENILRVRSLLNDRETDNSANQPSDWPNRLDRIWITRYPVRQTAVWLLRDKWAVAPTEHVETETGAEPYHPFPASAVFVPAGLVILAFVLALLMKRVRRRRRVLLGVWSLLAVLLIAAWLRSRGGGVDRFAYPTRWGEFELAINPGHIRLLHVSDHPAPFGMLHCRLVPPTDSPDDLWLAGPTPLVRPTNVWTRRGFTTSYGAVRASETSENAFHLWALPLWFLLLICLAYPFTRGAVAMRAVWMQWRRRPAGMCPSCGYALNANVSGVCPECGRRVVGSAT